MGVYIPNMEMPTSCPCELLGIGYDLYCSFVAGIPARVKEYYECCQNGMRPSWCPLIELPPHGRLIDADEMERFMSEGVRGDIRSYPYEDETWGEAFRWMDSRPAIIPADGGADG